jgi:hypothetical protein
VALLIILARLSVAAAVDAAKDRLSTVTKEADRLSRDHVAQARSHRRRLFELRSVARRDRRGSMRTRRAFRRRPRGLAKDKGGNCMGAIGRFSARVHQYDRLWSCSLAAPTLTRLSGAIRLHNPRTREGLGQPSTSP